MTATRAPTATSSRAIAAWPGALRWLDALNADAGTGYLGFNDWRLPTMMDTGTTGYNAAYRGTDCGYNVQTGSAATRVYSKIASL